MAHKFTIKLTVDATGETFIRTVDAADYESAVEAAVNELIDDPEIDASENDVFTNELVSE